MTPPGFQPTQSFLLPRVKLPGSNVWASMYTNHLRQQLTGSTVYHIAHELIVDCRGKIGTCTFDTPNLLKAQQFQNHEPDNNLKLVSQVLINCFTTFPQLCSFHPHPLSLDPYTNPGNGISFFILTTQCSLVLLPRLSP